MVALVVTEENVDEVGPDDLVGSVCFHGYKMTHGSRPFIVTRWELRLCHALKQVAQDCTQIFQT